MPIISTYPTTHPQKSGAPTLARQPIKPPHQAVQFAGGNPLDTIDPNHLQHIKNLPAHLSLQQIAMSIAPKTSDPAVMQYLAQRFQQKFNNVDHPVNPVHQQTLLHIAVSAGRPKLVEALLNEGANPLTENKKGEDALDWAENKISRTASPADRQAIQQMLFKQVKALAKQQPIVKDETPTLAAAHSSHASAPAGPSSWLNNWGLGSLFAQQKEASQKPAADALPNEKQEAEPQALAAPSVEPAAEESAQKELAQLQQTQSLLQSQLAEAKRNLKQLGETTQKAVHDKKQLKQEKKQLEAELQQLQAETASLENKLSHQQTGAAQAIKRLSKKEDSLRKRLEQKTEDLQKAEQKLEAILLTQDTQLKALQASHAQQIANLKQELQNAQKIAFRPPTAESPTSSSSGSAPAQSTQDRAKAGKLYAKLNGLQTDLSKANARIHHLTEELMLVQKQYRDWIARLLQEKDSLNFQLAQTQWQRDESAIILPKVHQVNEQLVANMNHQGRELQTLRQTISQQTAALSAQQAQLAEQAQQIQEQAELIEKQKAQKQTLSKTAEHAMKLSTSHRRDLQRQVQETYQIILDLLAQKREAGFNGNDFVEIESDLKQIIAFQQQQLKSSSLLSTALAAPSTSEADESSEADTPPLRRIPLRSKSFR